MNENRIAALSLAAFSGTLDFSLHYYSKFYARPTPSEEEIRFLLWDDYPEIIEDYPNDPRGPSCLIIGTTDLNGRIAHIVCADSPKLAVITAYFPAETRPDKWSDNFRNRQEKESQ